MGDKRYFVIDIFSSAFTSMKSEYGQGKPAYILYSIIIPTIIAIVLFVVYGKPAQSILTNITQALSILTGILVASLIPFFELAATKAINGVPDVKRNMEPDEREVSPKKTSTLVSNSRIKILKNSFSIIMLSLFLSISGLVLSFLVRVNVQTFDINDITFDLGGTYEAMSSVALYAVLIASIYNFYNILRFSNVLVSDYLKN